MGYNQEFRKRTKDLAIAVITSLAPLKYTDDLSIARKQIIRSATSVAANYRAVGRARSKRERFAKMCIVVEEADETLFWLEMIETMEYIPKEKVKVLMKETGEIVKVMSSYRKKLTPNTQS